MEKGFVPIELLYKTERRDQTPIASRPQGFTRGGEHRQRSSGPLVEDEHRPSFLVLLVRSPVTRLVLVPEADGYLRLGLGLTNPKYICFVYRTLSEKVKADSRGLRPDAEDA